MKESISDFGYNGINMNNIYIWYISLLRYSEKVYKN